jgi:hypothetical protein
MSWPLGKEPVLMCGGKEKKFLPHPCQELNPDHPANSQRANHHCWDYEIHEAFWNMNFSEKQVLYLSKQVSLNDIVEVPHINLGQDINYSDRFTVGFLSPSR